MFDIHLVLASFSKVAQGLWLTIFITFCAAIIALSVGAWLAFAELNGRPVLRAFARTYVNSFRSVPFVILVYLSYFGLPKVGLLVNSLALGVIALGLYGAAYFSEIARTAFLNVPRGQREAAQALGLSKFSSLRLIELPQALVLIVPPATGLAITLLKESAVLSVISVAEATFQGNLLVAETYAYPEILTLVALAYWATSSLIHRFGHAAEKRMDRWAHHR